MFDSGITGLGVNFQPGGTGGNAAGMDRPRTANQGVQEAIKVLSLRLPRVVGAQAVSPNALLSSPGSAGNPNIDSVVNRVWSKYFPTSATPAAAPASDFGFSGPTFSGSIGESSPAQYTAPMRMPSGGVSEYPKFPNVPRVTVGLPPMAPLTGGPGDRPMATPDGGGFPSFPGLIAPLPSYTPSPAPSPSPDPIGWSPYEI